MSNDVIYRLVNVGKTFRGPSEELEVLRGVNLEVAAGERLAIVGASGSGKTTLLHLLGTLDRASSGDVLFNGVDIQGLTARERAELRNRDIGFVFQFHHLLPEFNTLENVAMPGMVARLGAAEAKRRAMEALEMVGLENRAEHPATTLSGGERQRAAIARAISLRPKVLLADEPTGNLDESTGARIGELLVSLNRELGMTFVVVTHDPELAGMMQRRLELHSGELHAQQ